MRVIDAYMIGGMALCPGGRGIGTILPEEDIEFTQILTSQNCLLLGHNSLNGRLGIV